VIDGPERALALLESRRIWAGDVSTAIARLDEQVRVVLDLIYRLRLTQDQVARQLGLPVEAVRTLVARGLRSLAASLQLA
jgi:RNA polymerase sigma factor (sigma-70 family)